MANKSNIMPSRSSIMTLNKGNLSYLNESKTSKQSGISLNERTYYSFKVILIGDRSVGKTSVIQRFVKNTFENNQIATVNMDLKTKTIAIDMTTSAELMIWDTCGEERFKALTKQYYTNANGIMLIYNINDRSSFDNLSKWLKDCKANSHELVELFLVGNKVDLERKVSIEEVKTFSKENEIEYKEISALTGINVQVIFENLVRKMVDRMQRDSINTIKEDNDRALKLDIEYNEVKNISMRPKDNILCC